VTTSEPISPELALVDPELRVRALMQLDEAPALVAEASAGPSFASLLVSASVYLGVGIVNVALWGFALIGIIVVAISAAFVG
jgi:hypothetical protein